MPHVVTCAMMSCMHHAAHAHNQASHPLDFMACCVLEAPKSFSNVHFRNTTKIAVQVLALNFCLPALFLSFLFHLLLFLLLLSII